jgi:hypothetical protein
MLKELMANKRLGVYLLINVVVSALTTLLVLIVWTQINLAAAPNALPDSAGTDSSTSAFSEQLQISAVIGAGDIANERVLIQHVGDQELSLSGWRLRDANGNEYRFAALVLHPGAQVNIYTQQGDDSASELFWDRQVAVWETDELVKLIDPNGREQATYTVP